MNKQRNGNGKASENAFEFKGMKSQPGDPGKVSRAIQEKSAGRFRQGVRKRRGSAGQFKGRS
jgi:hypothetical protein